MFLLWSVHNIFKQKQLLNKNVENKLIIKMFYALFLRYQVSCSYSLLSVS